MSQRVCLTSCLTTSGAPINCLTVASVAHFVSRKKQNAQIWTNFFNYAKPRLGAVYHKLNKRVNYQAWWGPMLVL